MLLILWLLQRTCDLLHPGSKALQKPNSGVRQRHAAHRPMQQPNSETLLQLADGMTERR
jgi:hypothetical protein